MIRLSLCCLFLAAAALPAHAQSAPRTSGGVRTESVTFTDEARHRQIPVEMYSPERPSKNQKIAILSHGYGGVNTGYSFIANHLALRGYIVASIQHEIPGDEPLPTTGKPYDVRMPSWQRGVENIHFVIAEMKKSRPNLDYSQLVLIGHSHGGDTSILFADRHPTLVHTVISLDNRRMPFPRVKQPRIFSLRSSDLPADDGVLPSVEEQEALGMKVVKLPATIHNDMWDGATDAQKAEILRYIDAFLGLKKR